MQRHYFADKGLSNQGYGFSSSHLWMWELDHKEGWVPKNWCFWTVLLDKTLESPLDCSEIKSVNSKGNSVQFSLVQFSHSVVSNSSWPHELQHARPPCPSPTPRVHSDSCPSSQWCHPAISSSVVPFSSWPQSLPASESFPMSQLFAWGGQSTGVSALTSFLPKKSKSWIFTGRTDAEAQALILWPPDAKNWLTGKDPDARKDWKQEEKGTTEKRWLDGITDSMDMSLSKLMSWWRTGKPGVL